MFTVVQIPHLPDPRSTMRDGIEADILSGHDEIQLGIGADLHENVAGERQ